MAHRFLYLPEAAKLLGVDDRTLRSWAEAGRLPAKRAPGGGFFFFVRDLDALDVAAQPALDAQAPPPDTQGKPPQGGFQARQPARQAKPTIAPAEPKDFRLLRTGEVAQILHVSSATVNRLSDSGRLASVREPGRRRRFRLSDVAAFAAAKAQADTHPGMAAGQGIPYPDIGMALRLGNTEAVIATIADTLSTGIAFAEVADILLWPAFVMAREAPAPKFAHHPYVALGAWADVCASIVRDAHARPTRSQLVAALLPEGDLALLHLARAVAASCAARTIALRATLSPP